MFDEAAQEAAHSLRMAEGSSRALLEMLISVLAKPPLHPMNDHLANENPIDDSWLSEAVQIFPVGNTDQIVLMLSRFLEWGRVYLVATTDDSRGRSDAVAKKVGAFGLLGIDCHTPCQRQADAARLSRDGLYCDASEVTSDCIEEWAKSIFQSSGVLGFNASIVIDATDRPFKASEVAERQAAFFLDRKQQKFSGEPGEREGPAPDVVLFNESVFGVSVVFFQSDYTMNLYATVYSRLIPMSDEARSIRTGSDPAKYWSMRYR